MPNPYGILHSMEVMAIEHEPFALAVDDPYLSALIGTIEEPQGSSTAELAGQLTLSWWDRHGTGPSPAELFDEIYSSPDWERIIDDPGRSLVQRLEQRELLQRWLVSYWSRLGAITFIPGHDDGIRPGCLPSQTGDEH